MNKIIAVLAAAILLPQAVYAQQYVYPVYGSNNAGVMPYAPNAAPTQNNYANDYGQNGYAPQAGYNPPAYNPNVIPLSAPMPAPAYAPGDHSGYGTATYAIAPQQQQAAPRPAFAAVPDAAAPPAPTPAYATAYNWSGCYGGAYVGGAFGGDSKAHELVSQGGKFPAGKTYNSTSAPYSYGTGDGFMGGGTLGCNYQIPQRLGQMTGFVLGVEGEGGGMGLSGSGTDPNSGNVANDTRDKTVIGDWDGIVAGRVGAAFDRTLIYGKFGAVFSTVDAKVTDNCTTAPCGIGAINASGQKDVIDAALGGGVEYALSNAWSVKGEYMYLDTGDSYQACGAGSGSAAGSGFCSQHNLSGTHTFKVGLNYHFNNLFGSRYGSTGPQW